MDAILIFGGVCRRRRVGIERVDGAVFIGVGAGATVHLVAIPYAVSIRVRRAGVGSTGELHDVCNAIAVGIGVGRTRVGVAV